jgi:hypothetical protein
MTDDKILLTTLFEKKSQAGRTYFSGRLGKCRVVMLIDRETGEGGEPRWSLFLSPADPAPSNAGTDKPRRDGARFSRRRENSNAPAGAGEPAPNDPLDDLWPGPGGEPQWTP